MASITCWTTLSVRRGICLESHSPASWGSSTSAYIASSPGRKQGLVSLALLYADLHPCAPLCFIHRLT